MRFNEARRNLYKNSYIGEKMKLFTGFILSLLMVSSMAAQTRVPVLKR